MIFPYRTIVVAELEGDDFLLISRPEIQLKVIGPADFTVVQGLVDTGADYTILPKPIAEALGVRLRATTGPSAKGFGGQQVQLLAGEVVMELEMDGEVARWSDTIYFHDFAVKEDESVVLGHSGFLNYFTATFDGLEGMLTLAPNIELPAC